MEEMGDRPEEVDALGGVNEGMGFGDKLDRQMQEKDQYEENNYVRLAVTRKEKKRLQNNNRMRFDNEFDVSLWLSTAKYHIFPHTHVY
jgi:U3 small nucleolar ribonucleoprotein protein LCP5